MKIELLYFDGCPSSEAFLPRLRHLLERAGVSEEPELRRVESIEDAEHERFLGSPSLKIDGRDIEPGADERTDFGLKCRLYRTGSGMAGSPPDEYVLDAIAAARAASEG
ncbi:MAG TPA: hypothetical protein VG275_06425 [Solirubrobacteraceae bacterium]|jgi:hypothetical protein|nr:hypothetical protein [Solirubrobacteraceae bacterium]